ncbi:hypothetical protein L9F63_006909, partial [Diploptera punctata]
AAGRGAMISMELPPVHPQHLHTAVSMGHHVDPLHQQQQQQQQQQQGNSMLHHAMVAEEPKKKHFSHDIQRNMMLSLESVERLYNSLRCFCILANARPSRSRRLQCY